MDENEVELLARYENARWTAPPEVRTGPDWAEVGRPDGRQEQTSQRQGRAYWPLGAAEPVAAEGGPMANFQFLGATPVGSVLIIRFSWAPDASGREFLIHWDLSQSAEKDLAVASGLLFERLLRLVGSPDWMARHTVSLSPRVLLVIPAGDNSTGG